MRAFFSERPKLFFCNGIIVRELSLARHDPNPGSGTLDPSLLREWIKKAKKGDIGSYQRLYEVFARKVLNFIYRMVNSVEEAEDLTQETFVTVYRKLGSLKDDAKFEPWLFRIARNYVYQRYRSRTPATVPIEEPDDNDKGVKEPFQAKELQDVVQEVINSLPEKYREVFVLSAIQQLSYNEIADIVGRSLPSVKTDIHRARLEVRKKVKHYLKV